MHDIFIYRLASLFTISVVIWALFAYAQLWINYNMRKTSKMLSGLLNSKEKRYAHDPPDYCITQGFYRGRKIVCRMTYFSPTRFLRYDLRLHIHIEPITSSKYRLNTAYAPTKNPRLDANNTINYSCTSITAIKSYFLSSMIDKDEFIQIFEELTRAAEIVETNTSVSWKTCLY